MDETTQTHHDHHHKPAHSKLRSLAKPLAIVVGSLVVLGLVFYGGSEYQKHHTAATTPSSTANTTTGTTGNFGKSRNRQVRGPITAISPSSITVTNARSGTSQTFSITSSTTITSGG